MNTLHFYIYLGLNFSQQYFVVFSEQVSQSFVKFIPKYFIYFGAIVNDAIDFILSSDCCQYMEIQLIFGFDYASCNLPKLTC